MKLRAELTEYGPIFMSMHDGPGFYSVTYKPKAGGDTYELHLYAESYKDARISAILLNLPSMTVQPYAPVSRRRHKLASVLVKGLLSGVYEKGRLYYKSNLDQIQKKLREATHCATFECMMAVQAGVITPMEVIGDRGIVHELQHTTHVMHGDWGSNLYKERYYYILEEVYYNLLDMEAKIPGYLTPEERKLAESIERPQYIKDESYFSFTEDHDSE